LIRNTSADPEIFSGSRCAIRASLLATYGTGQRDEVMLSSWAAAAAAPPAGLPTKNA